MIRRFWVRLRNRFWQWAYNSAYEQGKFSVTAKAIRDERAAVRSYFLSNPRLEKIQAEKFEAAWEQAMVKVDRETDRPPPPYDWWYRRKA